MEKQKKAEEKRLAKEEKERKKRREKEEKERKKVLEREAKERKKQQAKEEQERKKREAELKRNPPKKKIEIGSPLTETLVQVSHIEFTSGGFVIEGMDQKEFLNLMTQAGISKDLVSFF